MTCCPKCGEPAVATVQKMHTAAEGCREQHDCGECGPVLVRAVGAYLEIGIGTLRPAKRIPLTGGNAPWF